jgi:hypothetical protein
VRARPSRNLSGDDIEGRTVREVRDEDRNQITWTGGVAQVTEHLLCKHEALNSNLSTTKKKKKKKKKRNQITQRQLMTG